MPSQTDPAQRVGPQVFDMMSSQQQVKHVKAEPNLLPRSCSHGSIETLNTTDEELADAVMVNSSGTESVRRRGGHR